jgi:hypothetical protein
MAPVAVHRMFPPYAGNHVYDRPQGETRAERTANGERELSRRGRAASQR